MQPDSVGRYMTSSGSEITLVIGIMLVKPSHSLDFNFFPGGSHFIQFLGSTNVDVEQ